MILQNITQVFTWKSESVRVKQGCKGMALAAMFARDFVSTERYVLPSCAYEDEEVLFGGAEILQKEVWKQ